MPCTAVSCTFCWQHAGVLRQPGRQRCKHRAGGTATGRASGASTPARPPRAPQISALHVVPNQVLFSREIGARPLVSAPPGRQRLQGGSAAASRTFSDGRPARLTPLPRLRCRTPTLLPAAQWAQSTLPELRGVLRFRRGTAGNIRVLASGMAVSAGGAAH